MEQPLKILLIGNYIPDRQESMLRFGDLLNQELNAHRYQVHYLNPPARLNRAGYPPSGLAKWVGYLDKFVLFPLSLKRAARRADVVHIVDHSNAMYVKTLRHKPHLITCHDVLAIQSAMNDSSQNSTGRSGKIFQRLILNGINKAYHIACVSQKSRYELMKFASIPSEAVSVIYNGLNYPYSPMEAEESVELIAALLKTKGHDGEVPSFIIHVGGNQWYKNRLGVLKIYARLCQLRQGRETPRLVMVGKPFTAEMRQFMEVEKLTNSVIELQGVSNEALRALYSKAQLLLFPSLAEGFGWPIIEAQACGCLVVTTNEAPMTEVGGAAAIYIDPSDTDEAAQKVGVVIEEDPAKKQERREASLANASQFSAALMAERYIALYRDLFSKWGGSGKTRH